MTGSKLGLIIGATFGLVYVLVNAGAFGMAVAVVLQVLAVAVLVGLLVVLFRPGAGAGEVQTDPVRFSRGYWIILLAEVLAVFGGNLVINLVLELPAAVLPWVTFVVGVHFLGLARVWSAPSLTVVGGALAVCGLVGFAIAAIGGPAAAVAAVAGVLPGFVLLGGSWFAAVRP